jgi:hypothetical protein
MKYTIYPKANKKIERDVILICGEIRKRIPNVLSIMMTGGFARGEGSVKIKNGKIFPYNDYDIQVISSEKIEKDVVDKISIDISKELGYKGIINFYPFKKEEQKMKGNFYIDLKCDAVSELKKLLPRIRTYELKNDSKILHGKDLRYLISDYKLKDIPLSEGAKLLLDRMSQMIEYYSIENKYDKEFLNYIIQQAYAACCTSLLLLSRKYQIGYKKSMNIFKKTYKKDFPELYKEFPNLDRKIEQFIKWKINPAKLPNDDVKAEWFEAKEKILGVARYFFSKFLNKKISNLQELSKAILEMRTKFYEPYLKSIIKNRIGINIDGMGFLFLPFVSLVLKYKYYKRLKKFNVNKLNVFLEKSPDLIIFASVVYILASIGKKSVNKEVLMKGKNLLNRVYNPKGQNWENVSLDYANAYISFFLQKI